MFVCSIKRIVLIVCSPLRIFAYLHRLFQILEKYKIAIFYEILFFRLETHDPHFLKSNVLLSLNKKLDL